MLISFIKVRGTEADFVARLVKLATVCCLFLAIHHNVTSIDFSLHIVYVSCMLETLFLTIIQCNLNHL